MGGRVQGRAGHVVHVDPTLIKPGEEIGFFSKVIWLVIGNLLLLVASLGSSPARLLAPQNQPVQDAILNGPSPWGVLSPGFLFKRSSKKLLCRPLRRPPQRSSARCTGRLPSCFPRCAHRPVRVSSGYFAFWLDPRHLNKKHSRTTRPGPQN